MERWLPNPPSTIRDQLTERVFVRNGGEHIGKEFGLDMLCRVKAESCGSQTSKFCQVIFGDLAYMSAFGLEIQKVVREPAPLGRGIADNVAALMEILRRELREVVFCDLVARHSHQAGRCIVEIDRVVQHDVDDDLDPVYLGSGCHRPKLSLASKWAVDAREIDWLVAPPPLPYTLVTLLRW
jgi:hypothetical protein